MDQDATSAEVGLDPGDIVLAGDPASYKKGAQHPLNMARVDIVAKWMDASR